MPETTAIGARFHSSSTMGSGCSPKYSNFRPILESKTVNPTISGTSSSMVDKEEEVNRKVMEILKRMTAEKPAELTPVKPMHRQARSVKKASKPSTPRRTANIVVSQTTCSPSSNPITTHEGRTTASQGTSTTPGVGYRRCSCSRSSCLKLYCECFAAGAFCGDCTCVGCFNLAHYQDHRQKAIERIVQRKPDAFHAKIGPSTENAAVHVRGCNCRRSGCLKNYCECFEARIRCTSRCRCKYCYNMDPENPVSPASGSTTAPRSFHATPKSLVDGFSEMNGDEKTSTHSSMDSVSPAMSLSNPVSCTGWDAKAESNFSAEEVASIHDKLEDPAQNSEISVSHTSPPICSSRSEVESNLTIKHCQPTDRDDSTAGRVSVEPPPLQTVHLVKSLPTTSQINLPFSKSIRYPAPIIINQTTNVARFRSTMSTLPSHNGVSSSSIKVSTDLLSSPCILATLTKPASSGFVPSTATAASNILSAWLALLSNNSVPVNPAPQPLNLSTFSLSTDLGQTTLDPDNRANSITTTAVTSHGPGAVEHCDPMTPCSEMPHSNEDLYTAEELATFEHLLRQRRLSNAPIDVPVSSDEHQSKSDDCILSKCDPPSPADLRLKQNATDIQPCVSIVSKTAVISDDDQKLPMFNSKCSRSVHSKRFRLLLHRVDHLSYQVRRLRRTMSRQDRLIRSLLRRSTIAEQHLV